MDKTNTTNDAIVHYVNELVIIFNVAFDSANVFVKCIIN